MKTLLATTAVAAAVALAGCGGSSQPSPTSPTAQCAHWKAVSEAFAQHFVADMTSRPSDRSIQGLADATYKVDALQHNLICPN